MEQCAKVQMETEMSDHALAGMRGLAAVDIVIAHSARCQLKDRLIAVFERFLKQQLNQPLFQVFFHDRSP